MSKQFNSNNSSFSLVSSSVSQGSYQQEWYEEQLDVSFVVKFLKHVNNSEKDLTGKDVETWLKNYFDDEKLISQIKYCLEETWSTIDECYFYSEGPNTAHKINQIFKAGRLLRNAWSMINNRHEKWQNNAFMTYWKYAFCRYERDEEKHKVPTMSLFKRAVQIYNETGLYLGDWSYNFLSMTSDVNILKHRAQLIDKAGMKFVDFFSKGYFKSLTKRTFLALPRFHDWLRGAADLFKFANSIDHMSDKDLRLLGHVCPSCRQYVINRIKKEYQEDRDLCEVPKGAIEDFVIAWQNQPKYAKTIPDCPGKKQWQILLKKCQEDSFLPEYPKVNLKPLAIHGLLKGFFGLLKRIQTKYTIEEHEVIASRDLYQAMGRQAQVYFYKWYNGSALDLHDAGQAFYNASEILSKPWQDFIMRFGPDAARLSRFSDRIERPTTLNETRAIVATMAYGSNGPEDVQKACYECEMSEDEYEAYLEWLQDHPRKLFESCPAIDLTIEGYRFHKLMSDDVRGPLLGLYTNCCQHPQGAGSDCAEHGWMSGYGAFYVVEHKNKIVGQSWAWRGGKSEKSLNTLCFDNIELLDNNAYGPVVMKLYVEAARRFLGQLGIERVTVGLGYNDLEELEDLKDDKLHVEPFKYHGYRDSERQKILYTMLEE